MGDAAGINIGTNNIAQIVDPQRKAGDRAGNGEDREYAAVVDDARRIVEADEGARATDDHPGVIDPGGSVVAAPGATIGE